MKPDQTFTGEVRPTFSRLDIAGELLHQYLLCLRLNLDLNDVDLAELLQAQLEWFQPFPLASIYTPTTGDEWAESLVPEELP
jgi:hypothetical protein